MEQDKKTPLEMPIPMTNKQGCEALCREYFEGACKDVLSRLGPQQVDELSSLIFKFKDYARVFGKDSVPRVTRNLNEWFSSANSRKVDLIEVIPPYPGSSSGQHVADAVCDQMKANHPINLRIKEVVLGS